MSKKITIINGQLGFRDIGRKLCSGEYQFEFLRYDKDLQKGYDYFLGLHVTDIDETTASVRLSLEDVNDLIKDLTDFKRGVRVRKEADAEAERYGAIRPRKAGRVKRVPASVGKK